MRKLKNILILAGGDSTRFWPLTDKVMFSFLGKPLIKYIFDAVSPYGLRIVIVIHPSLINRVKEIFTNKALVIPQLKTTLGMAGAVLTAKEVIKDEEVLIINGSDLFDFSFLSDFVKKIKDHNQLIITTKEITNYFPGGYLKFDNKGQLMAIVEKPKPDKRPSALVKLVVDYFSNFNLLTKKINKFKEINDDYYEKGITALIKEVKKIDVFCYRGYFYSLKYPWHVLNLNRYFLSTIKKNYFGKNVFLSKKATIIEPVYFEDGVKVGDYAKVVGPSFVGKNSVIADYTLVNQSHIGTDCLIGGYSEVTRSYLGDKVFLHRNYVGDSVIADNVLFGAGAVLANFRFDGKEIRSKVGKEKVNTGFLKIGAIIGQGSIIGINATLLPGVKIGKKTFIGPDQLVKEDIDDKKFFFNNQLRENIL